MINIKKCRNFCNENDENYPAKYPIYKNHINTIIPRNHWLKIENVKNEKIIYRQAQGIAGADGCKKRF